MVSQNLSPDYLFEVSWEVCNKVGGIYTVISTKAKSLTSKFADNYILIGPDIWKDSHHEAEFTEDLYLFPSWRKAAQAEGLLFKIGRWNVEGSPIVILVDFTPYFGKKDEIFFSLWENYGLDSLNGQWDYLEPALFGYAAARLIQSFYAFSLSSKDRLVVHFHEWMTGSGILHLKKEVPQAGTVFTTHATTVGRSIAGNGLPLYNNLHDYDAGELAIRFNIQSKQSLEKLSATNCDAYTVVSELTNRECLQFHGREADIITPNGFEPSFVPPDEEFGLKREMARSVLINTAEALLQQPIDKNSLLVINSGRYEFSNKGIDMFIDALGQLNKDARNTRTIIGFIMVPAGHTGPRSELIERLGESKYSQVETGEFLTHNLIHPESDPVLKRIRENNLNNSPDQKVKIVFSPCYLNGADGIYNLSYYDTLIGFDLSVFPSYYEPWGYTPLESIAFHIPTLTTALAGFGLWTRPLEAGSEYALKVLDRSDTNYDEVLRETADFIDFFSRLTAPQIETARKNAFAISETLKWQELIVHYETAFNLALTKATDRYDLYRYKQLSEASFITTASDVNKPVWKKVFIKSSIPDRLQKLAQLSQNLWWSWNNDAVELFEEIDAERWKSVRHNPSVLLNSLSLDKLKELEHDAAFMQKLEAVYDKFHAYITQVPENRDNLVAYFSMEFGIHDSLKIYSGGLGVLAGDYLKEASDSASNMIGIGLLYRYGYFTQSLSVQGEQIANYIPQRFSGMPVKPVRNEKGEWMVIQVPFPGRNLSAKIWQVDVGRVKLYLLDTDIDENTEADRSVTYQLYGGDLEYRLRQEVLLGIGGIKCIEALGLNPSIYHCNEGHAAFISLERLSRMIETKKMNYHEAFELVRASTLFTTHTPVPAGHDAFSEEMIRTYLSYYADKLQISWDALMGMGRTNEHDLKSKFSMSVLACKCSQEVNGVSKIHGRVSRQMFQGLWPAYFPQELHVGYVTNGVHFPTWVARPWLNLYNEWLSEGFIDHQSEKAFWENIQQVPDKQIWEVRKKLRKELFDTVRTKLMENIGSRQESPSFVLDVIEKMNENALTIGFARRFATYKRAHLIFSNLHRLSQLVNNPSFPVQFIFSGKAHPADKAGQDLIRRIIEISRMPEFIGKVIFLENYDMELAKKLVQGADVWLNTPTRPLEASGTSGEKAIMNGVLNCSVLDGWWAEGYVPGAGWALKEERTYQNQDLQDNLDAETLYFLFENEIIPAFYSNDRTGVPSRWISYIKNTISEIVPRFTMKRQLDDYNNKYYVKLLKRTQELCADNNNQARELARWKQKMLRNWDSIEVIAVQMPDSTVTPLLLGEEFVAEITLDLHGIPATDVGIEILFGQKVFDEVQEIEFIEEMQVVSENGGKVCFRCNIPATRAGVFDYSFRIYPKHSALPHRMDFPLVKWV